MAGVLRLPQQRATSRGSPSSTRERGRGRQGLSWFASAKRSLPGKKLRCRLLHLRNGGDWIADHRGHVSPSRSTRRRSVATMTCSRLRNGICVDPRSPSAPTQSIDALANASVSDDRGRGAPAIAGSKRQPRAAPRRVHPHRGTQTAGRAPILAPAREALAPYSHLSPSRHGSPHATLARLSTDETRRLSAGNAREVGRSPGMMTMDAASIAAASRARCQARLVPARLPLRPLVVDPASHK